MRHRPSLRTCPQASGIMYSSSRSHPTVALDLDRRGYHKTFFEFNTMRDAEKYINKKNLQDAVIVTQNEGYGNAFKTNYAVYHK